MNNNWINSIGKYVESRTVQVGSRLNENVPWYKHRVSFIRLDQRLYSIYRVQSNESQYNYIKLKPEFMVTLVLRSVVSSSRSWRAHSFHSFIFMRTHRWHACIIILCEYNLITLLYNAIIGFRLNVCICVLWPGQIESDRYILKHLNKNPLSRNSIFVRLLLVGRYISYHIYIRMHVCEAFTLWVYPHTYMRQREQLYSDCVRPNEYDFLLYHLMNDSKQIWSIFPFAKFSTWLWLFGWVYFGP